MNKLIRLFIFYEVFSRILALAIRIIYSNSKFRIAKIEFIKWPIHSMCFFLNKILYYNDSIFKQKNLLSYINCILEAVKWVILMNEEIKKRVTKVVIDREF